MLRGTESNSTVSSCGLSMDLTWQTINDCYLAPKTTISLVTTCLFSFLLAFGLEHLRLLQRKYDRRLIHKYAHVNSRTEGTKWDGERTYEPLDQGGEDEKYELQREAEDNVLPSRRRVVLEQCLRGVIQMSVFGIGLVVMIVFMYGNVWVILSTLGGVMVGCALFTKDVIAEGGENGHGTFGNQATVWMWTSCIGLWRRVATSVTGTRRS